MNPGPALPVLVYDGDCGFCTRSAVWVEHHARGAVGIAAHQSLTDEQLAGVRLTRDGVSCAAWWVGADRRTRRGHLAIGASLVACGGAWSILGRLAIVPPTRWLAAATYRIIVRFRHRLPGSTDACAVDTRT